MKKLLSFMLLVSISSLLLAQPQGRNEKNPQQKGDPFETFKSEKIAFITTEVGLTPEEAQVFWPLYNKIEEEQCQLRAAERAAYRAMQKAVKSGEGDVDALLNAYLSAHKANVNLHLENAKDYRKILSAEKTAKFYASEEKFLRVQINRLKGDKGPHPGMQPGEKPGMQPGGKQGNGRPGAKGRKEAGSPAFGE